MKKIYTTFLVGIFLLTFCTQSYAQVPQAINYQAIARLGNGSLLPNQSLNLRLSILSGSPSGTIVYQETHSSTTNLYGLFTLKVGLGNVIQGNFSQIPWSNGNQWVRVEVDQQGNGNYVNIGETELLSVPFALYAESSGGTGTPGPVGPQGPAGADGLPGPAGQTGPQGPAGNDGAPGPAGPQGPTGTPGPEGPQGTVGPAGIQGAPGPQGPAGADGAPGPQGLAGADGAQGPAGNDGAPGPAGPQGQTGTPGPQGPQGPAGPVGPAGIQGAPGPQGPAGADGAPGPQGLAGADGAQGPQGPVGNDGAPGPAGPQGPTGTPGPEGPQGPVGPAGIQGAPGPQGPAGADGAQGPQGLAGADGDPGPAGPQGPTGASGPEGPQGPAGPTGLQGTPGPQGPAGADGAPGPTGPQGPPGIDGGGALEDLNSFIDVFHRPSTVATTQAAPTGGSITYVVLNGMTETITVPAGKTYKVILTAHGSALNTGAFADCVAQYTFFINGAAAGASQRVSLSDGLGANIFQPGALSFYYGQWSISHVATLAGGQTYTIDVRGAHAGPAGSGTTIQLAGAPAFVGEAALNVVVYK